MRVSAISAMASLQSDPEKGLMKLKLPLEILILEKMQRSFRPCQFFFSLSKNQNIDNMDESRDEQYEIQFNANDSV